MPMDLEQLLVESIYYADDKLPKLHNSSNINYEKSS